MAATRDGIVITDPRQPDNPIVYVNGAFELNTGYSREEVLGKNPRLLQGKDTSPAAMKSLHDAVAAGASCRVTLLNYRKDGTPFWNEVQISPVTDDAGTLVNFIGVQRDVTESIRTQQELQRLKAAAEAANRAKTHFLASTSHEIRTALNGVVGPIELLLDTPLGPEQLDLVRIARRSCDGLLSVIQDVLDLSRIEAGKLELERVEIDPAACVMDTCRILAATARRKGLTLRVDLPPDLPTVLGDPGRLRQVLLNLGNNAIKFTERGGITVRISAEQRGPRVVLSVSVADTGVGMTPDQSERVFQPFVQAAASVSREHGGSGLGLAICRQLVEAMGGAIGIESARGVGTTVTFTLPFDRPTTGAVPSAPGPATPLGAVRALVVDDNETNRVIARELLKKLGIEADVAADGLSAVDAWVQQNYGVILMDCHMPGMDGYQATREIRAIERARGGARTLVIALTGQAFAFDRERCIEAGMDGFLSKPVTKDALATQLRQHLPAPAPRPDAETPESGVESEEPVVDDHRLSDLCSGDPAFEHAILRQFLSDATQQVASAEDAAQRRDSGELLLALHSIKGTAANVGATALSKTAARAEAVVAAAGCSEAAERVGRVRASLETLRELLALRLPPKGSTAR